MSKNSDVPPFVSVLSDGDLNALLPEHLTKDAAFSASIAAVKPHLQTLAESVPNLLIFARLTKQQVQGQDSKNVLPFTVLSPLQRLIDARGGLKIADIALLEALAWQFHVDFREVATDDATLAQMVLNAILWHRKKGTPQSLKAALELFGHTPVMVEEDGQGKHWASYQLGLPQVPSQEELQRICTIAYEMQPARCRLWRIHTELYDHRPIVCGVGPVLGDGWLSFYSGVSVESGNGDDVLVSFGAQHKAQLQKFFFDDTCIGVPMTAHAITTLPYVDTFVLSRSRLGDSYPSNTGFVIGQVYIFCMTDAAYKSKYWQGSWNGSWLGEANLYDRSRERWDFRWRGHDFCQAVLSDNGVLGDINFRLGATYSTFYNQAKLSGFKLSEFDASLQHVRLRRFEQKSSISLWPQLRGSKSNALGDMRSGSAELSLAWPKDRGFILSQTKLSEPVSPSPRTFREEHHSLRLSADVFKPKNWEGAWQGAWQGYETYDATQIKWHFHVGQA